MRDTPSLRNVVVEFFEKNFRSFTCDCISPCTERNKKFIILIECHISVHHSTETDTCKSSNLSIIFLLNICSHIAVAVLKSCPDSIKTVCPDTVYQLVFPFVTSRSDRSIVLIDKNCLNSCGTKLNTKNRFAALDQIFDCAYICHFSIPPVNDHSLYTLKQDNLTQSSSF